jgi:outer membrane protein
MKLKAVKRLLPIVLIIGFVLLITGLVLANGGSTVGYLDMQRIQQELPAFQELQDLIKRRNVEFNYFGNYLQTQQDNEFVALEKEKEAESKGKSEAERKEIEAKYQEKAMAISKDYQNKLETENNRLSAEIQGQHDEIMAAINRTLEAIAKKEGYAIILEKSVVYYGGEDITEQVIEALRKDKK